MKLFLELFYPVIDNVTETSDLLSFGLTCKTLAAIIIPNHLFYHTVYGNLSENTLWIYLILNPKICGYIRRLEITQVNYDRQFPKMRLRPSHIDAGVINHPYATPTNTTPLLWTYELIGRALHQMVNLKAFQWFSQNTPVFDSDSESSVGKFPNLRVLQLVPESAWITLDYDYLPQNRPYVSIFDTPIMYSVCNLVSFTIRSYMDPLDTGKSLVNFLTMCRNLKFLKLDIIDQNIVQSLISRGYWPNLRNLSLLVKQDHGPEPTEGSTRGFLSLHSNLVSLRWHISFHNHRNYADDVQLSIPSLSPGSLPQLQALDADEGLVRAIIGTPCNPPRRLRKILDLPADAETWEDVERNFQGIDKSSLEIVGFSVTSLSQLARFGTMFPNVECIDFPKGLGTNALPDLPEEWDLTSKSRMSHLPNIIRALSGLRNLRVVVGFQFWEPEWRYEDERRNKQEQEGNEQEREENNHKIFRCVTLLFPRFEFCGLDADGVVVNRIYGGLYWDWDWDLVPMDGFFDREEREQDFSIPEEKDRSAI